MQIDVKQLKHILQNISYNGGGQVLGEVQNEDETDGKIRDWL